MAHSINENQFNYSPHQKKKKKSMRQAPEEEDQVWCCRMFSSNKPKTVARAPSATLTDTFLPLTQ